MFEKRKSQKEAFCVSEDALLYALLLGKDRMLLCSLNDPDLPSIEKVLNHPKIRWYEQELTKEGQKTIQWLREMK
jgi:hypothetical protein